MEMVSTITTLISNVVTFAGGLLLLFGAVTLGTNLKDHIINPILMTSSAITASITARRTLFL